MEDWWIKWGIVSTLTVAVLTMVGSTIRGRAVVDEHREVGVLTYSTGMKRLLAGCGLVSLAMMIMVASGWPIEIGEDQGGAVLAATLFGVMALGAVGGLWEMRARVEVSKEGVVLYSPWRGRVPMDWTEIREVTFRGGNFVLRAKGNRKLRVSGAMSGIDTLIASFRAVLPRKVYTRSIGDYNELKRKSPVYGAND